MSNRPIRLFPDSPSLRQFCSASSLRALWRGGEPVITAAIMAVCIAVWLLETLFRFLWMPGLSAMLNFGMLHPVTAFREPWTFVTSMFLHAPGSPWHIIFNMLTLWCMGPFLERLMGHWEYLILYLVGGIGGGVGMMVWAAFGGGGERWFTGSYGASGALFALFAACLVVYRKVGEDLRSMLIWMGLNFLIPFMVPNIAWQAHVAGFIAGGLYTMMVIAGPRIWRFKPRMFRCAAYGAIMLAIMIVIFFICNANNPLLSATGFSRYL